jgi:hypothetical protein
MGSVSFHYTSAMITHNLALGFIACAALIFGQQLDSNSVIVSDSRYTNPNLQPDQVVFGNFVDADYCRVRPAKW